MKIVIAGNYGAGNVGDEMILEGMLATVKSVAPNAKITVLSENPTETSRKFTVESKKKFPSGPRSLIKSLFSKNRTRKTVKNCDYFILGGGGLFGSLTQKANIIWGIQAFMAYLYKKPVIMYGQSIGELKGRFRKWLIRKLFQKAALIAVRDENSKKRLKAVGVHKKIYIIPDLAFRTEVKNHERERKNEMIVALRQMKNLDKAFKKNISDFLKWLIEKKNWKIKFVEFQKGKESDKALHEEIKKNLSGKDKIGNIDSEKLTEAFADANMILGMRLHSIITAIKTNTPFIAINYAPKVEDLLEYANLGEFMLSLKNITFEKLKSLFNSTLDRKEKVQKKLEDIAKKNLARHEEMEILTLRKLLSIDPETRHK